MKNKIVSAFTPVFFLFISVVKLSSQVPPWAWAVSGGGTSSDYSASIAGDQSGNVFIVGKFSSHTFNIGTAHLICAGSLDMFLAKYDAAGNVLWAKSAGGTGFDEAKSIAVDAAGNVYVAGTFSSGSMLFDTAVITVHGVGSDIFLAKYNLSGNVMWVRTIHGTDSDDGVGVACNASGDVFVTGTTYSDTLSFDTLKLLTPGTNQDFFLAKYNFSGNIQWAKGIGSTNNDYSTALTIDASGNILVTGSFNSPTLTFDTIHIVSTISYDLFLAKFDGNGNVFWVKSAGGNHEDESTTVTTDGINNIYMSGNFSSDSIRIGTTNLYNVNTGNMDLFVAGYDSSGNSIWAVRAGGSSSDFARTIATDHSGNIFVAGYYYGTSMMIDTATIISAGGNCFPVSCSDMFLFCYNTSGNYSWAEGIGGTGIDQAEGVLTGTSGELYLTGDYYSPALAFDSITLTASSNYKIFLAKKSFVTGLKNIVPADGNFIVYPNPAMNYFTIQSDFPPGKMEYILYDISGRRVLEEKIPDGAFSYNVNTSFLESGSYRLQIFSSGRIVSNKRVIISK